MEEEKTILEKYPDPTAYIQSGLPWPTAKNREAWESLPEREALIRGAEEALGEEIPLLTAAQFMAFVREGDRQRYEAPYFRRRHLLIRLAVGEAAEGKGRFLGRAVDLLWLIAEETSWVISAHNVDPHPGALRREDRPLPEADDPVIDLFAAQTAATVSLCCRLLGEGLDGVSTQIVRRMRREVEARVIGPFLAREDYWWMGVTRQDLNNWTPWILSNVLVCLLFWVEDRERLARGIRKATVILDRWLACLPEDGALDEGVAYWNMAGASLLDCLELLYKATGTLVDVYAEPKIRAIARFPLLAHIDGPWFLNFADCDAKPRLDWERVRRYGELLGDGALIALGEELSALTPSPWPMDTPEMSRVLNRLFHTPGKTEVFPAETAPDTVMLRGIGLWAARRGRLYAAIKGGHNGENHNHNDLGSFVLYLDGRPSVIDVGNMTYTARTFSDGRYALFNTRSANHNLPLIGPFEQAPGREHAAETLRMDRAGASFSLTKAYPERAGLLSFTRKAALGEDALVISDEITLSRPLPVTWVFMLREEPALTPGLCRAGALRLTFPEALSPAVEAIEVTDPRLARSWPGSIYRLCLCAPEAVRHSTRFVMGERNQ